MNDPQPGLSVVMPVYNEVLTIREILRRVDAVPIAKEIIVVDDGSKDGTREVLRAMTKAWPREDHPLSELIVLFQPQNVGKGRALRRGFGVARGAVTIIQDADLEYDPQEIPRVITPILDGRADVVYGSRFAGAERRVLYFWHSLGNWLLTNASNMLTDLNLTDMETCYKAFRTEVLREIPLREDAFGFEPEITAKVARLGLRIYEVPISYHGRAYAEGKKITWRDGLEAFRVIVKYWVTDDVAEAAIGRRTLEILKGGKYNDWLFARLRPYLGRRIVEVGAGLGNLSRLMLDCDHLVITDVEAERLRSLEERFAGFANTVVTAFDLRQPPPPEVTAVAADTVLCVNVLEHIEDDRAALGHMRDALAPGGRLVLLVPAHAFAYGSLDRGLGHYRRYQRQDLEQLVTEVGFTLEHCESLNGLGLAGWALNSRLLRRDLLPRNQTNVFQYLTPWLDFERRLGLPVGLSLLLVARRV